ncbi:nicotinate phosphoribosyltransferase [Baaleninema simplex]|uniref:nicotinate phosphoribosyltransferase n=1 Tax=Baaleninema simplex TaxID=2862350 RepID=UPI000347D085|nr:nicotinate phosphoribosyltransferase [Baaleninema simplex]
MTSTQSLTTDDRRLNVSPADYSLLTDLYQLTMAACYIGEGLEQQQASFELFVRKLPDRFGYLIAMGLEQAIEYIENLRFSQEQIETLKGTGIFSQVSDRFWETLAEMRFSGNVWAVPEGTAVFANEPLLRVEAPLWQAQLLETYVLNVINTQSLIATRAARIRDVAGERALLLEFGTRRAFSPQASLFAARASIAAGFNSTSNVLAAFKLGRKPTGTMAHSLVQALRAMEGSESHAFTAFHHHFPGAPLLIDTYDTVAAARQIAHRLETGEMDLHGVRIDSGDIAALSKEVRSILPDIPIFASGDLDEWEIARLLADGAVIDGYGVGTKLVSGEALNGVYKLVEVDGVPVMKKSSGKQTYPGRKQVFRRIDNGQWVGDRLTLSDEAAKDGEKPLLELVVKDGKILKPLDSLESISKRTTANVAMLPRDARNIHEPKPLEVSVSAALDDLTDKVSQALSNL